MSTEFNLDFANPGSGIWVFAILEEVDKGVKCIRDKDIEKGLVELYVLQEDKGLQFIYWRPHQTLRRSIETASDAGRPTMIKEWLKDNLHGCGTNTGRVRLPWKFVADTFDMYNAGLPQPNYDPEKWPMPPDDGPEPMP